jgi:hypothetical protein
VGNGTVIGLLDVIAGRNRPLSGRARVGGVAVDRLAGQEHGPTDAVFDSPQDPRTSDHVHGRFG